MRRCAVVALLLLPGLAAAAEWRVTKLGYGPVQLGMTLAQASAAASLPLLEHNAVVAECHYAYPQGDFTRWGLMLENDHVTRIDIAADDIATLSGVHNGTAVTQLQQVYPWMEQRSSADGATRLFILFRDQPVQLVFETDGQRVTRYRVGQMPSVQYRDGCNDVLKNRNPNP